MSLSNLMKKSSLIKINPLFNSRYKLKTFTVLGLILLGLIILPSFALGAEPGKITKQIIWYTPSINYEENQQYIVDYFDVLIADRPDDSHEAVATIKSLKPSIFILGYYDVMGMQTYMEDWDYVDQIEEWFVHDKDGNRITNNKYGFYLMNPLPNLSSLRNNLFHLRRERHFRRRQ